ncbi:unnamed protein product [marine sediment metagenome]|uniref:Uncharacterized protein n=1 Tax=marine sediment metagenome TaxID=412755 RepID=X1BDX3_9ZZZZ
MDRDNYYEKPKFCEFDEDGQITIIDSINNHRKLMSGINFSNTPLKKIIAVICAELQVDESHLKQSSLL